MKNTWLKICLLNLLVIALLGLFLRWFMVAPPEGFDYKNLLQAHSHVALLGWLYAAFFVVLTSANLPPAVRQGKTYQALFWLVQAAVLGMLPAYFQVLFWLSTGLPAGILLFFSGQFAKASRPTFRELEVACRARRRA